MNAQCARCKEIVPLRFALTDGGIDVTCSMCSQTYFVAQADDRLQAPGARLRSGKDPEPEAGSLEPDPPSCPKCTGPLSADAAACPRCGLLREKWHDFDRHADAGVPDEVRALWADCEAAWDDAALHDRFCELAVSTGSFAYAARCYRDAGRSRQGDATAQIRLEKVARMSEAALLAASAAARHARTSSAQAEPYRNVVILLIVLVLAAGIGGVYLLLRADERGGPRLPATPAVRATGT